MICFIQLFSLLFDQIFYRPPLTIILSRQEPGKCQSCEKASSLLCGETVSALSSQLSDGASRGSQCVSGHHLASSELLLTAVFWLSQAPVHPTGTWQRSKTWSPINNFWMCHGEECDQKWYSKDWSWWGKHEQVTCARDINHSQRNTMR
jgi:hypothetical protein